MPGRSLNVAPTEKVRRGLLEYRASAQFCRRSRCQRTSVERRAWGHLSLMAAWRWAMAPPDRLSTGKP